MSDDPLAWTVLSSEVVYTCPGFEIVSERVRLPDASEANFDFVRTPPSVVILPLTPTGEVVVIEEWREAVKRCSRGLPAGTKDPEDVDLAETARRELREETGYACDRLEALASIEPANGLLASRHHYFVAHDCRRIGSPTPDHDESIRVDTVGYDALMTAAIDGQLQDGRTVLGLLHHRAQGR